MEQYLTSTRLLDFENREIQELILSRGWHMLDNFEKIRHIYNFVRDEIRFGYNEDDRLPASRILKDGYGQCNTKSTLFMALLRAVDVPSRIHGFTIDKALQKGAITGVWYKLSPKDILHSWVEVYFEENWYNLEGIILDRDYLAALQQRYASNTGSFCGFGVFTDNLQDPAIDWDQNDTYIQAKGINRDFGLFSSPDELYSKHRQKLNLLKKWVFKNIVRHLMNRNVENIRKVRINS